MHAEPNGDPAGLTAGAKPEARPKPSAANLRSRPGTLTDRLNPPRSAYSHVLGALRTIGEQPASLGLGQTAVGARSAICSASTGRSGKLAGMDSEPKMPDADAPSPETLDSGPIQPSPEIRAELVSLLEADDSRLGEVYRGLQRALDANAIADETGGGDLQLRVESGTHRESIAERRPARAPTVALGTARKFRAILRSARLSSGARAYLETNLRELERRANDETARVVEVKQAQEQTQVAEALNERAFTSTPFPTICGIPSTPTAAGL